MKTETYPKGSYILFTSTDETAVDLYPDRTNTDTHGGRQQDKAVFFNFCLDLSLSVMAAWFDESLAVLPP